MRRWLVLLAAGALSGCVLLPAEAEEREAPPRAAPQEVLPAAAPARFTAYGSAPRIDVALDVEDRWVRPHDLVNATAASPSATSFEWYLASRNPLRTGPPLARASLDAGDAAAFLLGSEGRHALAVGGAEARLGVTVRADAVPLTVLVQVVGEGPDARFVPEDAFTGVGGRVVVERPEGTRVEVQAEDPMRFLSDGARVSFAMPEGLELGDYDLVVVARAGGDAWGEAAARIIYDKRKPSAHDAWAHESGFTLGPLDEGRRHEWATMWPLASLVAVVDARSDAPGSPSLVVALVDAEGRERATMRDARLEASDLPAGSYAFRVASPAGVLTTYRIEVEVLRVLTPPDSFFSS